MAFKCTLRAFLHALHAIGECRVLGLGVLFFWLSLSLAVSEITINSAVESRPGEPSQYLSVTPKVDGGLGTGTRRHQNGLGWVVRTRYISLNRSMEGSALDLRMATWLATQPRRERKLLLSD